MKNICFNCRKKYIDGDDLLCPECLPKKKEIIKFDNKNQKAYKAYQAYCAEKRGQIEK